MTDEDRGDIPNHEQALAIIRGLESEIKSLRNRVQFYVEKWHGCRKHLRIANRSLEVYSRLAELQTHRNLKLFQELQEEYKKRK